MKTSLKPMIYAAFFLALALTLPFLTGQIQGIGSMLLPMHLPVLLCGFVCGGPWGLAVGIIAPLLRSAIWGMPPFYPIALAMSAELGAYGLFTGLLQLRLPLRVTGLGRYYLSLVGALVAGRLVWGAVRVLQSGLAGSAFTWEMFLAGALINAVPGILLQLLLIPALAAALERSGHIQPMQRS